MLHRPIKCRLNSLSPSSESLAPSSDSFVNPTNAVTLPCTAAILSAISEFVIGLYQTSTTDVWCHYAQFSEKQSLCITANYSVSRRHYVRHLGICYRICVKLLQLKCDVIAHNSVKKNEISILINGWFTANYSVSQPPFCPPSWNFLSDICHSSTTDIRCHYEQFSEKTKSPY